MKGAGQTLAASILSMAAIGGSLGWAVFHDTVDSGDSVLSGGVGGPGLDDLLSVATAQFLGSPSAPLVLVEFGDFRCPYCAAFAVNVLPELTRRYVNGGQLRVAFFHAPAGPLRPLGVPAAEAAECASRQGLFWAVHDTLYRSQPPRDLAELRTLIAGTGVKTDGPNGLDECLGSDVRLRVADHAAIAYGANVRSTPTLMIGYSEAGDGVRIVKRIVGAPDLETITAAIESALAARR